MVDKDGKPVTFTVVGIFEPKDTTDIYWKETPVDFDKMIFTDQASFDETVANYGVLTIYYATYNMLDYAYIDHTNASDIRYYLSAFSKQMVTLFRISAAYLLIIRTMQHRS